MSVKRKIADFLCAFAAFSVVLVSIAVLTGESFFEGAVVPKENGVALFGTEFVFDNELLLSLEKLLCFNDVIFFDGFAQILRDIGVFFTRYVMDCLCLAYSAARWVVGLS